MQSLSVPFKYPYPPPKRKNKYGQILGNYTLQLAVGSRDNEPVRFLPADLTVEQVFLDLDERVLAEQIRVAQRHGVQHLAVQIISAEAAHTHALSSLRSQPANEIRVRIQIEASLMVEGLQVLLSGAEQSFAV